MALIGFAAGGFFIFQLKKNTMSLLQKSQKRTEKNLFRENLRESGTGFRLSVPSKAF
jgi:hypothetical protein